MLAKTKMLGLMVAVIALASPMTVWADTAVVPDSSPQASDEHHSGDWHHDGDWRHAQEEHTMAQVLNLSEDQEKQLKDIKHKQKDAMKSVFEQLKANRVAFDTEIVKATPDVSKINDIQTQLKGLQSQMVDNRLNSLLDIKKVLTPEQFAGYMALEKEERLMKHEGHNNFGQKDRVCKMGDGSKHGGDNTDKDND